MEPTTDRARQAVKARIPHRRGCLWALWAGWTLLGLCLVSVVLLEGALRGLFALKDLIRPLPIVDPRLVADGYEGGRWVERYFAELETIEADYAAYVGFRVRPKQLTHIHFEPDGLRRTRSIGPKPGVAQVLVFGGSSAWGYGARDEFTIPSLLGGALDDLGYAAHIENHAQIGHVSTQAVVALELALRQGKRPDVVIFHDGVNDILAAMQSGEAGNPQNESNRVAEFNILQSPARLFSGLLIATARASSFQRVAESTMRRLGWNRREGGAAPLPHQQQAIDVLSVYNANIRIVEALSKTYGFRPVFCWQPVVFGKKQTAFEAEKAKQYAWLQAPIEDVTARLSTDVIPPKNGFFLDLSRALDDDPHLLFIDFCHVTEAANAEIASRIAASLIPLLESDPGSENAP